MNQNVVYYKKLTAALLSLGLVACGSPSAGAASESDVVKSNIGPASTFAVIEVSPAFDAAAVRRVVDELRQDMQADPELVDALRKNPREVLAQRGLSQAMQEQIINEDKGGEVERRPTKNCTLTITVTI